jgi:medium-chain acyl-[acyl-carrier-protein] hydrolase
MNPIPRTPWIAYHRPVSGATIRLFCFPYAGGGASIFVPWIDALAPACEVCPVQLPGRETRFSEPLLNNLSVAADLAAQAIAPLCAERYALFGHSLGAILAYEVAQRFRNMRLRAPESLIVSARRGALLPHNGRMSGHLPEDEFKQRLMELNGTPREFLAHPELAGLLLPRVRQDFLLDETYAQGTNDEPLDCPISSFGGSDDVDVPEDSLRAWSAQTRSRFELTMFPGGDHFFIQSRRDELLNGIRQALARTGQAHAGDPAADRLA